MGKLAATVALDVLLAAGYLFVARPYQMRWGATNAEGDRPMPRRRAECSHPTRSGRGWCRWRPAHWTPTP